MDERQQPTPGEIVIMASGAVMLIFSFLPFYKASGGGQTVNWSAWSNSFSIFPLVTLMVLMGVAVAAHVAARRFGSVQLGDGIWQFTWSQLHLALSFLIALTSLTYVIRDTGIVDKGIGAWLILLGAIGLTVGAVMQHQQGSPSAT